MKNALPVPKFLCVGAQLLEVAGGFRDSIPKQTEDYSTSLLPTNFHVKVDMIGHFRAWLRNGSSDERKDRKDGEQLHGATDVLGDPNGSNGRVRRCCISNPLN